MIEGSFDISEVDVHLCRGCAIAAPESLASCRCRYRRTRTVCVVPRERVGGTGGVVSREQTRPGDGDPIGERAVMFLCGRRIHHDCRRYCQVEANNRL